MTGKAFGSFTDIGRFFGVTPKSGRDRGFICRRCGREMRRVEGTNVVLCACGKRLLTKYVPGF